MVAYTTTYNLKKPTVADDEDVWGGYLNDSMDIIDDVLDGTVPVTGIDINSGTLDNVVIGGTTANSGTFTVLSATTSLGVTGNITVSGTVDGVDIAARDAVLTSTTTTANAALPKAGGTMTGAITFAAGQSFDGRDVSADGAKLDGIESGATADQTKADIDALGINAATLDSLDSTQFLRSDANDSGTGSITLTTGANPAMTLVSNDFGEQLIVKRNHSTYSAGINFQNTSGSQGTFFLDSTGPNWNNNGTSYKVWHENNDGSGSGLDADTVDGLQASSFLRSDTSDSWSGTLTGSGPITTSSSYIEAGRGSGSVALSINDGYGNANLTFNHRAGVPDVNGQSGRIEVNVDAATGEGVMSFELSSAPVTSGQAVGLETGLTVAHDYIEVPYRIRHQGDADTYIEFANNTMNFRTANAHEMQITNSGVLLVNSALHEDYDALSGTSVTVDPNTGGAWSLTMTGNTTFTFGATVNNYSTGIIIELTGNGGTVTWPTSVDWAGGTAPDAPASGETDIYVFWTRDGGTTWYGVQSIDAAA